MTKTTRRNEEKVFHGFELTELRAKKKEAELGYLRMALFDPPQEARWGKYNDRQVDEKAVKELVAAFQKNLDNCTEGTAIDIAVRPGWLEDRGKLHESVEGKRIGEVNALTFNEEGKNAIKKELLVVLGGNHRCHAVRNYVTSLKKEREGLKKEQQAATKKGKTSGGNIEDEGGAPQEEGEEDMTTLIMKLDEDIETASQWVVRVYDRGE